MVIAVPVTNVIPPPLVLKVDDKDKDPLPVAPPVIIRVIVTPGKSVVGDTDTKLDIAVAGTVNLKILPVLRSSVAPAPVSVPNETTLEEITPLVTTGAPWSARPPVGSTGRTFI